MTSMRGAIKTRNYVKSLTNSRMVLFLAIKNSSIAKTSIILTELLLLAWLFVPAKCTQKVYMTKPLFFLLPILILRHTIIYECKSIFKIQLNAAISNSQEKQKIFRIKGSSKKPKVNE